MRYRNHDTHRGSHRTWLRSFSLTLRGCVCLCVWLAIAGAWWNSAWAQENSAEIQGTATDVQEQVVPGAAIVVTSLDTGVVHHATTTSTGSFVVPLLPPGPYRVQAQASGFKTWETAPLVLAVGDIARLDIRLQVGSLTETVQVTGQAPALQTDSPTLGSLFTPQAIEELPLDGRNVTKLLQLSAGATPTSYGGMTSGARPDDRRPDSGVSVNGMYDDFNNNLLDGMDNNEGYIGTIILKPAIDGIEEVKLETNMYSADVGRTAGGVINIVTKNGSNQFHGSLHEFLRNQNLDARNFFAPPGPITPFHQNQFGGSLGGPIKHDRTFFFGDYEGFRQNESLIYVNTVPTAQERVGNFSGINPIFDPLTAQPNPAQPGTFLTSELPNDTIPQSRLDPVALNYMSLYPLPNAPGLSNNFTYAPIRTQRMDTFDTRIDHYFSERDVFFGRYSFADTDTFQPGSLPPANGIQPIGAPGTFPGPGYVRSQNVHLNWVHTFNPNMVLEAKAQYSRFWNQSLPANYGKDVSQQFGIPGSNVDLFSSGLDQVSPAGYTSLGDYEYIPLFTINNQTQYIANLSLLRSHHAIRVGVSVERRDITEYQSPDPRGDFSFNPDFTTNPNVANSGNSMASLLLGYPSSTYKNKFLVWPGYRYTEFGAYVQDDWRVKSWLSLNLGLRYDVFPQMTEVHNRISNWNLATGQDLIAGQNGVSDTAGLPTDWHTISPRVGFAAKLTPRTVLRGGFGISYLSWAMDMSIGETLRNAPFISTYTVLPSSPFIPANTIDQGFPAAVPQNPLQPSGSIAPVAPNVRPPYAEQYNVTLQRQLGNFVLSAAYVGVLARKQQVQPNVDMVSPSTLPILPRLPYLTQFRDVTSISYMMDVGNANYMGLQLTAEYRFNHGFSLLSNYTWSHLIDDYCGDEVGYGCYNWPQLINNWHLERANGAYDIRQRWTTMASYQLPFARGLSGIAGLLGKAWQVNGIFTVNTGLPFTINDDDALANTGGGDRPNIVGNPHLSNPTVQEWFNTAAFAFQPFGTIGNVGRDTLYTPGAVNLDFSLGKSFPLGSEKRTLQFRVESFNVLNHPNFGYPDSGLGDPSFGAISNTANYRSREIQFGLKFQF